jgi:predicted DNA-binding transcriptional regulator AlpA
MAAASLHPSSGRPTLISSTILNSWKEIAHYLDRGVRTVQRWEKDLAFPVRRPRGKSGRVVIALRSDIDNWLSSRPLAKADFPRIAQQSDLEDVEPPPPLSDLVQESRLLRARISHSRGELREVVMRLTRSIERNRAELDATSSPCSDDV